ncbi:MAG: AIR carboxylase family protein [Sphaerochaetaceae bacterium]
MNSEVIIIMGSEADRPFVASITAELTLLGISYKEYVASAHKQPLKVLQILQEHEKQSRLVYITVAGRSNALSGFVAANSIAPVLAVPPFADKLDMLVNIHSTLQMPSNVPVMTVLDPRNAALAVQRILGVAQ